MYRKPSQISFTVIVLLVVVSCISVLIGMNLARHPSLTLNAIKKENPDRQESSRNSLSVDSAKKFNCPSQQQQQQKSSSSSSALVKDEKNNNIEEDSSELVVSSASSNAIPSPASIAQCVNQVMKIAQEYVKFSEQSENIRKEKGPLNIAAFSRLWVPPLHGSGGMQFHALHLYSQLAVRGHNVHVFVTGPSHGGRDLMYEVDQSTHVATITKERSKASLFVYQVASSDDGEYSVAWFENCLQRLSEINATVTHPKTGKKGFDVVHSESWAGVPNIYQMGLPAFVTWHGSMLDWFRNEVNFIVHNFRMKGKMTGDKTAQRMRDLGTSVAYESYMLLTVPDHIVISDSAASDLRKVNLIDADSVHVIYNGVNTKNFKPADDRDATRKNFLTRIAKIPESEITSDLFIVGCGGRLDGIKGHHQLSVAMKTVLSVKNKNIILLVAGRGQEGHRYESLKSQGLRVHMLGMLPQADLAQFYQVLDTFVDPFYQHHGLNTVMLEASLTGVPIVVTDLASAQTTVPCNGGFGLTFPLGEPQILVERLLWLEEHRKEGIEMGKAGRKRAQMLFSSAVMASRYEHLMYEAVEKPRPLVPILGKVTCKHTYPRMCYRAPFDVPADEQHKKKKE